MSQSIEVVVRLRPSSKGNTVSNDIESESAQSVIVEESSGKVILNRNRNQAEYTFTRTFGPDADQLLVYGSCDVIPYVLDGVNCCVMTYGQTSTGKTYTMYGRGWEDSNSLIDGKAKDTKDLLNRSLTAKTISALDINDNDSVASAHDSGDETNFLAEEMIDNSDHLGIIPRCINDLFDQLNTQRSNKESFAYSISLQIMQIYNEKIYDLLHDRLRKNPLVIRETSAKDNFGSNVYVRGLSVYRIDSKVDAFRLIKKAIRNKAVRSTDLNSVSSRSHTVLQLFVMTEDADADGLKIVRRSTLSLIDLAGSEKWRPSLSTTGSVDMDAQVKEMTNINTSLHVLGNCIAGLIESDRKHIPYRDSVLTRLLQSTLGGNGKSIIVATIHSEAEFVDETYSTLQFATRASKVKVTLAQNVGVSEKLSLVEAQKHIKMLKKQLELLRTNPGSAVDLTKSLTLTLTNFCGDNSVCEQCVEYQSEVTGLKQRVQTLEQENQFLKQKCEEFNLNNSAFYSNQSSVESSPIVKSSKKKKREKANNNGNDSGNGAGINNNVSNSKDKGIIILTSPMLLASSLTAEPLQSIPEHRRYGEEHDHHSDHSDLTDTSMAMLTSSLDRALQLSQQQQQQSQPSAKAHVQSTRNSYDSDSSSISGLHTIFQEKNPADFAAAAFRGTSDSNNKVGSNYSSISGSILGVPANNSVISTNHLNPSSMTQGLVTPTISSYKDTVDNNINSSVVLNPSATFTPTTTSGLPPPSPAIASLPVTQKTTSSTVNAVHTPVVGTATTSNNLRSSHGSTLLASILGTPITGPISLQNQGGVCQKHNLEDCILCAMFNGNGPSTGSNNNHNMSVAGATGASATLSAALTTGNTINNTSILSKFSTPIHGTAPSSVTSSISSILKAANNPNNASIASVATTSFLDNTTPKAEEFGVTTLRRSKTLAPSSAFKLSSTVDEDITCGKCKHGLLNCLLCNGIPPFDYSTAITGGVSDTNANNGPSRIHVLPPMAHSSNSGISNTVDMISTLESPHSKSSFPLSSSARSSVQDRWMSSHRAGSNTNDQGLSSSTLMGGAEDARALSAGLDTHLDASHHNHYKSKRVQEIQAITQLRQSHHLEQQQLQQKLHPRSSSSPLPVSGVVGFPNTADTSTILDVPSVRSSLVRQMRTEQQLHHHSDTTQQQRPQAMRYQPSSRHTLDNEDDEEDDEGEESYPPSYRSQKSNQQQSNITYEDDEDVAVVENQHSNITNNNAEKKPIKDPKKKKSKKVKKKKLTSTRGSDTEGSAVHPDGANKFDPQLFDQLVNQPCPSSKSTAHTTAITRHIDINANSSSNANAPGNEKVINHRTVMMALKGSKKK